MKKATARRLVPVLVLALPVLYVLSYGPAISYHHRSGLTGKPYEVFEAIYTPLWWVADRWKLFERVLGWWCEVWM